MSALPSDVDRAAIFGAERTADGKHVYRYVLTRRFLPPTGAPLRLCAWMNPSLADGKEDDASIRVGMGFARRWGDGGIVVINMGDLIETDSRALPKNQMERLGPKHWEFVERALSGGFGQIHADVLCGWGDEGAGPIAEETVRLLRLRGLRPVALQLTKSGNPGHPLRKSAELVPVAFETPGEKRDAWARTVRAARAQGKS